MIPEKSYEKIYQNKTTLLGIAARETVNVKSGHDAELDTLALATQLHEALQNEVLYSQENQLPLDVLELCSGETLGKMGVFLRMPGPITDNQTNNGQTERSDFWTQQRVKALSFLDQLERLTVNGSSETVSEFLASNRKMIGFCADFGTLNRLGQILSTLYADGLLEKDSISIAHYPGSFNPFPHVGHAEVAEEVIGRMSQAELLNPRVVATTVSKTEEKSIEDSFTSRVGNLVKGFADRSYVSVLGVPSDLTNQRQVVDFRQLISQLDAQGKTRHVMGSDTLISRIKKARNGDLLSNYLINTGGTIYLSVRAMDNYNDVLNAVNIINSEFDSELIILPDPTHQISGTMVRALDREMQRKYFASMHINPNS